MGYTKEQRETKRLAVEQQGGDAIKVIRRERPVIDANTEVCVTNGFNGVLTCTPPKTSTEYIFDSFGELNYMTFGELASVKSRYMRFFEDNWFLIDDPDVLIALGVEKYYKNALTAEDFESFYEQSVEKIKERVPLLSNGQKQSLIYKCGELIEDGAIDSRKDIAALEEIFGVKFIEEI